MQVVGFGGIRNDAKHVLLAAKECATNFRHKYVDTEHIVFALVERCPHLFQSGIQLQTVQDRILELRGERRAPKHRHAPGPDLPYHKRTKIVLEIAMKLAREGGKPFVDPSDLLEAVVEEPIGIGGRVLRELGLAGCGQAIVKPEPAGYDLAMSLLTLDDTGDLPYYEQLVAQIKEFIAKGQLKPGDRLPPVRRLADHLDIAPGTAASAYSKLEEEGVVKTAGRLGTRIAYPVEPALIAPEDRASEMAGLLRPVVIAAFHLGATAEELFNALTTATKGVFGDSDKTPPRRYNK